MQKVTQHPLIFSLRKCDSGRRTLSRKTSRFAMGTNRGVRCVATFITGKSSSRSGVWPLISTCLTQPSMRPFSVHLLVLLRCLALSRSFSSFFLPLAPSLASLSLALSYPLYFAVHPVRFASVKRGEN